MDVLIITIFISLVLVAAGLVLFVSRLRAGDLDHSDRLSMLPLEEDRATSPRPTTHTDPEGDAE